MTLIAAPPELVRIGLRAMKSVLTLDGPLDATQRAMIRAGQSFVHHTDVDVDALETITPEEFARLIPAGVGEPLRRQFVHSMAVLLTLTGIAVSPHAVSAVRDFAHAVGIDDPLLDNLRQYSEKEKSCSAALITSRRLGCRSPRIRSAWRGSGRSSGARPPLGLGGRYAGGAAGAVSCAREASAGNAGPRDRGVLP